MDLRFHPAQAALALGDVDKLAAVLTIDPTLAASRSSCGHPTLLQSLVLSSPPVPTLEPLINLLAAQGAELTGPLIAASGIDNLPAIAKLLDLGARIEGNGLWSPLEEALYWCQKSAASFLMSRGAPITNLRIASGLGDLNQIALCFNERGELTPAAGEVAWPWFENPIPDPPRRIPAQILANALVYAAAWDRPEAAKLLIDRGAQVNLIPAGFDFAGASLHYAALQGRRQMVDLLLTLGANPSLTDTKIGKLPEDWASHAGHASLAIHLQTVRLNLHKPPH